MNRLPPWAWALAGVAALAYLARRKDTPSMLTGAGANLAALARSQAVLDPASVSLELDKLSAQAAMFAAKVKENPSLGTLAGLSPTQIDYIVLPPEQFRTTYGFTTEPDPVTP